MTVATLTYHDLDVNTKLADPTAVTVGTGGGTLADAEPELTVLRVAETGGSTDGTFTVLAGAYPPALASGQGDLAFTITKSTTQWIGPLESGRFLQNDGSLSFGASENLSVTAFRVARH